MVGLYHGRLRSLFIFQVSRLRAWFISALLMALMRALSLGGWLGENDFLPSRRCWEIFHFSLVSGTVSRPDFLRGGWLSVV